MLAAGVLAATTQAAQLDVVATSSSTAALVRELASERATVTVLTPPDRDLHFMQARPSMLRALRRADLVTAVGADLEAGWLPLAIQQAANPRILPGQPGYFEAAAQVSLLDTGLAADRALGDVHPLGNPHVNLDPVRMATVADALARRLGALDPEHAANFLDRARDFSRRTAERVTTWRASVDPALGAVLYHPDANYLLERIGVPLLGYLEPVPGVPPTAAHISALTQRLGGRRGVIVYTPFQSSGPPETLARASGWRSARLPLEPPVDADGEGYLEHIQRWVDMFSSAGDG